MRKTHALTTIVATHLQTELNVVEKATESASNIVSDFVVAMSIGEVCRPHGNVSTTNFVDKLVDLVTLVDNCNGVFLLFCIFLLKKLTLYLKKKQKSTIK